MTPLNLNPTFQEQHHSLWEQLPWELPISSKLEISSRENPAAPYTLTVIPFESQTDLDRSLGESRAVKVEVENLSDQPFRIDLGMLTGTIELAGTMVRERRYFKSDSCEIRAHETKKWYTYARSTHIQVIKRRPEDQYSYFETALASLRNAGDSFARCGFWTFTHVPMPMY